MAFSRVFASALLFMAAATGSATAAAPPADVVRGQALLTRVFGRMDALAAEDVFSKSMVEAEKAQILSIMMDDYGSHIQKGLTPQQAVARLNWLAEDARRMRGGQSSVSLRSSIAASERLLREALVVMALTNQGTESDWLEVLPLPSKALLKTANGLNAATMMVAMATFLQALVVSQSVAAQFILGDSAAQVSEPLQVGLAIAILTDSFYATMVVAGKILIPFYVPRINARNQFLADRLYDHITNPRSLLPYRTGIETPACALLLMAVEKP